MITESKEKDQLLTEWYSFRQQLETIPNPLEETTHFFLSKPKTKFYTDPYDKTTWPTPWELITENEYCKFNLLLGICYTLQLTERFKDLEPVISIVIDPYSKTVYYTLVIGEFVYGYADDEWILVTQLPKSLKTQKIFNMDPLH